MPVPTANLASDFHETNKRLRFWLDRLTSVPHNPAAQRPVTPEEMAGLLSELTRAGARLRALPSERQATLEQELAEYREQVERLRAMMPLIHAALLQERARLEQERNRLASASQWAERSRQTL